MDALELRPLALGELLDRAFILYRRNFWLFAGIMSIPSALTVPFSILLLSNQGGGGSGATPSAANVFWIAFLVIAFLLLLWIAYPMAMGAATFAVSQTYLGQPATVRDCYGKVRGKIFRISSAVGVAILRTVGVMLLIAMGAGVLVAIVGGVMTVVGRGRPAQMMGVIVLIGTALVYLAATVLGSVWALRYSVCIPVLLLENLGAIASLRRSAQLTRNRRWQVFVAVLLASVVGYVGVIVFQGPFFVVMMFTARGGRVPQWIPFAYAVTGAIGGAITGPVLIIVLVLLYYDTRIRKEAFDLQFMMSSLNEPAPPQGTPSLA